jgi:cobalt-zinc-cadmium efflux system membrane fusion protein
MNANVGMHIDPSDVILEIVDTNHLHLELAVFEKDILKVKEGQEIKFTVPEATRDVFDAEVHLVGKSIEGNDRTINVHGHLDPKIRQRLLTGMFVDAGIVVDSKKGLSIPVEALITANNKSAVLLLQGQKGNTYTFKKVAVTVGEKSERFVEILPNSEINASSRILVKGVFELVY